MIGRKYCGTKTNLPQGYTRKGSAYECLRAGIRIGEMNSKEKLKQLLQERIEKKGLLGIKDYVRVGKLNKDELRSIAVRLTGSNEAIPRYWAMNITQLRDELIQRGFQQ